MSQYNIRTSMLKVQLIRTLPEFSAQFCVCVPVIVDDKSSRALSMWFQRGIKGNNSFSLSNTITKSDYYCHWFHTLSVKQHLKSNFLSGGGA